MKSIETAIQFDRQLSRESWFDAVRSEVKSLRFGAVQIVGHDSQVVEIAKSAKIRLPPAAAKRSDGRSDKRRV